jgi:hypothetical protein
MPAHSNKRSSTTPPSIAPSPSLAHVLKGTGADVTASLKDWAGVVRAVPSSVSSPAKFVEQYFGAREEALARRRRRALELVDIAPKVRLPLRRSSSSA